MCFLLLCLSHLCKIWFFLVASVTSESYLQLDMEPASDKIIWSTVLTPSVTYIVMMDSITRCLVGARDPSLHLWTIFLRSKPTCVMAGNGRKGWSVASALAVTSHKEGIWLIHFQFLRLWKSVFLIICRNWGIRVR